MGQDEETNNFNGGTPPVTPNPRAQFMSGNRLGMRPARDLSAAEELNRIVEAEQKENIEANGGDIILAPTGKQPKDKKIIVIIVLAIAIVITFTVGILMKGGIGAVLGSNTSHSSGDYKKEFNQFANYLISGEAKEDALTGSNNSLRNYAFNKAIRGGDDNRKKFIEEAYRLFEVFYADFSSAAVKDGEITSHVSSYYNVLKMLYLYETSDKIESGNILDEYMEKSEDSARNLIENSYSKLAASDSEAAKGYAEILRADGRAYLAEFIKYRSNGCISKEKGIDQNCVNHKVMYDLDAQNYMKAHRAVYVTYNNAVSEITSECWVISGLINKNGEEK